MTMNNKSAAIIALGLVLGLCGLGGLLGKAALEVKQLDRSVTVKGLAEQDVMADVVIWPIEYSVASNNLSELYDTIDKQSEQIRAFLTLHGIEKSEITVAAPAITDKSAQRYGSSGSAPFRYTANQTVTVYSHHIKQVREVMGKLSALGKQGIVLSGNGYQSPAQYIFTRLNDIKPKMIEQATMKAREVARKFAKDSDSKLGKIKRASQGQFSIRPRDKNNPHIKKVRVVSTVEYYLSD